MSYQLMNYVSGKQMWDTINLIMEGTEDVQENRSDILTSQYESFRSLPGESITQVFEKYTKLLNELTMKGKTYPLRETNMKFMMTLPHHVEHKSSSIREIIDFTKIPLEMIYGQLKTYEMEQKQRVIIYGPGTVDNKNTAITRSAALVVDEPTTFDIQVQTPRAGKEAIIEAEMDSANLGADESDYYTLEELEQMEDKIMAYLAAKFSHIRFKRNPKYKFKGSTNRFQKSKYSSGSGFKGGYKTCMIDRIKSRCYNCNDLGHFATECRKPRQARDKKDVYEKKDSYDELKRENAKLKQQLEALSGKQKGKAYIAEGKSWDDTDSDEDEEYLNLALMADSSEESPQSSQGKVKSSKVVWILDSGCSRHMTGEESLLTKVVKMTGPIVTFGDDNKGFTTGYGNLRIGNVIIENISLVEGLKHNLLSISQFCDKGYNVDFRKDKCLITNRKDEKLALLGVRKRNLFIADLSSTSEGEVTCFYSKASSEQSWLWHKKLSHLNFKTMNSLVKRELVRRLPLMEFYQEGLCEACEKGKSKKASHRSR
ncbi:hypothetical protein POM88_030738 [Heracleum sosnowskyi]|uniref:CCHC-type domain-containing protein n=1 Tax=Heracleum sosnowskyi TaxID=360622 RepID=A0AAD8HZ33_9APIA|nr:hypothetical protein POM88_030738 [Heracleum sosnowskyi]